VDPHRAAVADDTSSSLLGDDVEAVSGLFEDLLLDPGESRRNSGERLGHQAWAPAAHAVPDQLNW
jgi:hypothetical protein